MLRNVVLILVRCIYILQYNKAVSLRTGIWISIVYLSSSHARQRGTILYKCIVDLFGKPELHADKVVWQSSSGNLFILLTSFFRHDRNKEVLVRLGDGVYQFGHGI